MQPTNRMNFWILSCFCLCLGLLLIFKEVLSLSEGFREGKQKRVLIQVICALREIEETLVAGLVPEMRLWDALQKLEDPWKTLSADSLKELRDRGSSIVPTLIRLRQLAESHQVAIEDARAKASQAWAQAMVCALLVPVLGGAFYVLLPGVAQRKITWGIACLIALGWTGFGAFWLLLLASSARWGGLSVEHRPWVLASQCAGERFLALVRVGTPPDLAWSNTCDFLSRETPRLALAWGYSIWQQSPVLWKGTEEVIGILALSIKKSIQVSLMEGRPCIQRVEAALLVFRQELQSRIERQLVLLPTQALKPLFVCVAPSLLGLLAVALWLASIDSRVGEFN